MKGASSTARVLIATALLLTPWNQAKSTNDWNIPSGLSYNCSSVSSSPLINRTTKHLGRHNLLLAHKIATENKKKATTPCTAQYYHTSTHYVQRALHIICLPAKMFTWSSLAKRYLPPACLYLSEWHLCPQVYRLVPQLGTHKLWSARKKTAIYFIPRINTSNAMQLPARWLKITPENKNLLPL